MPIGIESGDAFSVSVTNATSAIASKAGVTGKTYFVTDIAGSSDKAGALLLVKQGTTIIWQVQLQTSAAGFPAFQQSFRSPLRGVTAGLVSVTVDGTSACYANIAGYALDM